MCLFGGGGKQKEKRKKLNYDSSVKRGTRYSNLYEFNGCSLVRVLLCKFCLMCPCWIFLWTSFTLTLVKFCYSRSNKIFFFLTFGMSKPWAIDLVCRSHWKYRHTCWEDGGKWQKLRNLSLFFVYFQIVVFFPSERSCSRLETFCVWFM